MEIIDPPTNLIETDNVIQSCLATAMHTTRAAALNDIVCFNEIGWGINDLHGPQYIPDGLMDSLDNGV